MFRFILAMAAVMIAAASADVSSAQGPTSEVDVALSGSDTNVVAAIEGEVAPTPEKTALDQWVTWCIQGGRTMIFLGALSILGLGCALERAFNLRLKRIVPEGFSSKIVSLWRDDKIDEVRAVCAKDRSMLARVVETMLEHAESTDFQEVKMFAEDKASRELRLENRKSAMLATVATLSPLLGLFGTVVGLLGAFTTVAAVGEMGNPAILADDISKALITTVAGLAISMPALFMHNIIKHRLGLYAVILEEEVSDLVHNLFIRISH